MNKPKHRYGSGSINKEGYRLISVNGVPYKEHRWVMQQTLGRPLDRAELVHHKNENKLDNRPENLELMTPSAHTLHHKPGRAMIHPQTNAHQKWCPKCQTAKPRTEFFRDKHRPDGVQGMCKPCRVAYMAPRVREWKRRHRAKVLSQ